MTCKNIYDKSGEPDFVGYTLRDAKMKMAPLGITIVDVLILSQPKENDQNYNDDYRIIRQQMLEPDKIRVYICK